MPPQIATCLEPGEKILWQAQPRPYVFMLRGIPAIFYGITWSVLGAIWYRGAGGIGEYSAFEGWWKLEPLLSLPFIARWHSTKPPELRVFTPEEMAPPHLIHRFDGLSEIVLTRSAQGKPYLVPRLESGFFGIKDGESAETAIRAVMNP